MDKELTIEEREFYHNFNSFCTFVSLLYDKKMNYATVFIKMLENKTLRDIFKYLVNEDNDYGAIQKFIKTEPSVSKSKYVTKFLNKFDGL